MEPMAPQMMRDQIEKMGKEMMFEARETGSKEFDLKPFEDSMLFVMEDILKNEMATIFNESAHQLEFVLTLTYMVFLMPVNFINKVIFSRLTRTKFKLTLSEFLDFVIVLLVIMVYTVVGQF